MLPNLEAIEQHSKAVPLQLHRHCCPLHHNHRISSGIKAGLTVTLSLTLPLMPSYRTCPEQGMQTGVIEGGAIGAASDLKAQAACHQGEKGGLQGQFRC